MYFSSAKNIKTLRELPVRPNRRNTIMVFISAFVSDLLKEKFAGNEFSIYMITLVLDLCKFLLTLVV